MALEFKRDDLVKLVGPTGDYRYGYVQESTDGRRHLLLCLHDEGDSMIAFEAQAERRGGGMPPHLQNHVSEAELQVVERLAEGLPNRDIAERLALSQATVRTYVRTLRLRFGLQTRAQLATYAVGFLNQLERSRERPIAKNGKLIYAVPEEEPHGAPRATRTHSA